MPRSLETEFKPTATEIGSATHLLLEHLDFTRPCDTADLKSQLQSLLERKLIAPSAARSVDLDSICWLATSPIGELIRAHGATARRELPVYFALNPAGAVPSADPLDRIMIRTAWTFSSPRPAATKSWTTRPIR
jgi:ATP-dependent helicase/nuclease subunit A